jgi:outer membrane protein assembly factor BamB
VDGILFAKSARTLYAFNPKTGGIHWEFTPYPQPGEWMYSQPAVGSGRVFIGDRAGDFHCLDARTGKPIWRRRVSRSAQVNATALVAGSRVITANNAGAVVCYAARTGETIWRRRIEGPCARELLRLGSNVIVGANSLYGLDTKTGAVRFKIGFPQKAVNSVTVAQKRLIAVFGPGSGVPDRNASRGYELVNIDRGRVIARRPVSGIGALGTYADIGLVVRLDGSSIEFIDPSTGAALRSWPKHMALPDGSRGLLYGLADEGVVFAEQDRLTQ